MATRTWQDWAGWYSSTVANLMGTGAYAGPGDPRLTRDVASVLLTGAPGRYAPLGGGFTGAWAKLNAALYIDEAKYPPQLVIDYYQRQGGFWASFDDSGFLGQLYEFAGPGSGLFFIASAAAAGAGISAALGSGSVAAGSVEASTLTTGALEPIAAESVSFVGPATGTVQAAGVQASGAVTAAAAGAGSPVVIGTAVGAGGFLNAAGLPVSVGADVAGSVQSYASQAVAAAKSTIVASIVAKAREIFTPKRDGAAAAAPGQVTTPAPVGDGSGLALGALIVLGLLLKFG